MKPSRTCHDPPIEMPLEDRIMKRLAISLNLMNATLATGVLVSTLAADFALRSAALHFLH